MRRFGSSEGQATMTLSKYSRADVLAAALNPIPPAPGDTSRRASMQVPMETPPGARIGLWEATPGTFSREIDDGEVMFILEGEAVFTSSEGRRLDIGAGDTILFAPGTRGDWVVTKTLRKSFVLF